MIIQKKTSIVKIGSRQDPNAALTESKEFIKQFKTKINPTHRTVRPGCNNLDLRGAKHHTALATSMNNEPE